MTSGPTGSEIILHATAVAFEGRALLITGASGSGKSTLALQLIASGCALVADDRVVLRRVGPDLLASCPDPLRGLIEARGIGLLRADPCETARVVAVVDLDQQETERLPSFRDTKILEIALPYLAKTDMTDFPAAILQYLKGGREDTK